MRARIVRALSLIFVTPVIAFSQVKMTSKDLRIVSATASEFSSGAARQGEQGVRGVQYEIKAIVKAKNGVVVDSLITERGSMPVETIVGLRRNLMNDIIKRSDTVQIVARVTNDKSLFSLSKEMKVVVSKSTKAKQYSFLLYRSGNKRCLVPIDEFSKNTAREPNQ